MAAKTRSSLMSGAVVLIGCFVLFIGCFEPTKTVLSIGQSLVWAGFIQFYFGAVSEIGSRKRILPIMIGILLSIVLGADVFRSLRDNLPDIYWICGVVATSLLLQILISYASLLVCSKWQRVEMR